MNITANVSNTETLYITKTEISTTTPSSKKLVSNKIYLFYCDNCGINKEIPPKKIIKHKINNNTKKN
jgi:hypothetical protein